MAAVTRRQYKGAATQTTITTALAAGGTSITLTATTGWPSTASVPFFVVISPGTASEEKCLATISGSVLTLTRAQDDTTAQSHSSGASIYPVFTADDADDANLFASTMTTRGDLLTMASGPTVGRIAIGSSGSVLKSDGTDASWGTVAAANIASSAVETAKINDAAVTGAKLANLTISDKTDSYTLVVGDRNTRIIVNKATATAVTVPNSVFSAGDVVFIANKGAGTCTVTAAAGVTVNGSGTALAQHGGGTLLALSASTFTFFPAGGGVSTLSVEYLLVGGGGAGGTTNSGLDRATGGGGAGGMITATDLIAKGNAYTVTVGAGASASSTTNINGNRGNASSFIRSANGGGGGGGQSADYANQGFDGGSGGGQAGSSRTAGQGISGEGNNGGNGDASANPSAGGGGGGKGGNASGSTAGTGSANSYTGSSITYAAGGAGGSVGSGGAGTANRGNGGEGNKGVNAVGGAGGSGRVVLQILTADLSNFTVTTTGSPTTNHPSATTYTFFAYDSTGSFRID